MTRERVSLIFGFGTALLGVVLLGIALSLFLSLRPRHDHSHGCYDILNMDDVRREEEAKRSLQDQGVKMLVLAMVGSLSVCGGYNLALCGARKDNEGKDRPAG